MPLAMAEQVLKIAYPPSLTTAPTQKSVCKMRQCLICSEFHQSVQGELPRLQRTLTRRHDCSLVSLPFRYRLYVASLPLSDLGRSRRPSPRLFKLQCLELDLSSNLHHHTDVKRPLLPHLLMRHPPRFHGFQRTTWPSPDHALTPGVGTTTPGHSTLLTMSMRTTVLEKSALDNCVNSGAPLGRCGCTLRWTKSREL